MDLIDRQTAIEALNDEFTITGKTNAVVVQDYIRRVNLRLHDLPSAQPEIIRCKDCKYAHLTYGGDCKQCDKWLDDDDFHLTLYLDGDFYCGYAERKDNG